MRATSDNITDLYWYVRNHPKTPSDLPDFQILGALLLAHENNSLVFTFSEQKQPTGIAIIYPVDETAVYVHGWIAEDGQKLLKDCKDEINRIVGDRKIYSLRHGRQHTTNLKRLYGRQKRQ